jgi:hypothetical protein
VSLWGRLAWYTQDGGIRVQSQIRCCFKIHRKVTVWVTRKYYISSTKYDDKTERTFQLLLIFYLEKCGQHSEVMLTSNLCSLHFPLLPEKPALERLDPCVRAEASHRPWFRKLSPFRGYAKQNRGK